MFSVHPRARGLKFSKTYLNSCLISRAAADLLRNASLRRHDLGIGCHNWWAYCEF